MFGGPWLGVLVFVVIAIALGWGLTKLLQGMTAHTTQTLNQAELDHGFDPEQVYLTQEDLLIGKRSYGDLIIAPGKEYLPPFAPGRRHWPTTQQYRESVNPKQDYPDLDGLIERNTPVRFVEVIDDLNNKQTRILVMVQILDGPFAQAQPILGMHFESTDTDTETGNPRYVPRAELFSPVQSVPEDTKPQ